MIDTHAHIDFETFEQDRQAVIERFFAFRGKALINVGVDLEADEKVLFLAGFYKKIFVSLGLHPGEAKSIFFGKKQAKEKKFARFFSLVNHKKVVAIGETGLDYFHSKGEEERLLQKKLFLMQINLAKEKKLPLIIHCRDAYADVLEMLSGYEGKFVMHCYGGSLEDTKNFLAFPLAFFSFTGNITYAKPEAEINEVIRFIPLERIMLETDCPFLAPVPQRGKRNEPAFLVHTLEALARIKKEDVELVEEVTDKNAISFFGMAL
jgi:TatD DNase family protein